MLHSPAFRRLQGKTQLFPGWESDFFRNRLTHSLEVAQVAKSIALRLNATHSYFQDFPIDTDLVETAALAHDLGHPPFGHNGEQALNRCMKNHGGFEGNAQTLRILSRLEKRHADAENDQSNTKAADSRVGLNLTHRSLAAVIKYDRVIPNTLDDDETVKGYFDTESQLVGEIKQSVIGDCQSKRPLRTIECQIMDFADDIAYSTYDLEDALKAGFITPMRMISAVSDERIMKRLLEKPQLRSLKGDEIRTAVVDMWLDQGLADLDSLGFRAGPTLIGDARDLALLMAQSDEAARELSDDGAIRTPFTSELINTCVENIYVEKIDHHVPALSLIGMERAVLNRVEILKHLTYELIIQSPRLITTEYRGAGIVTEIFAALSRSGGERLLPDDYRTLLDTLRTNFDIGSSATLWLG